MLGWNIDTNVIFTDFSYAVFDNCVRLLTIVTMRNHSYGMGQVERDHWGASSPNSLLKQEYSGD